LEVCFVGLDVIAVSVGVFFVEQDEVAGQAALTAFRRDLALPSGVTGPWDFCPFSRLALVRASETFGLEAVVSLIFSDIVNSWFGFEKACADEG
jgi:hypothetical protein